MRCRNLCLAGLVLVMGLNLAACSELGAFEKRQEISKTFDIKSGGSVSVENTNGSITVEGWDQEKVDILAVKTAHGYDDRDAEENLKRLEVIFESSGNDLKIETRYPHRMGFGGGVQYTLRVPRKFGLDLRSTNGHVQASDVQGRIRLGTTNGSIKAENIGGSLNGSTTNGKITVSFTHYSGDGLRLTTTNGSIQLSLPDDVDANISAHTTNGSVRTDFPITTQGTLGKHSLEGKLGKGGALIELRTTNGSVSIVRTSHQTV
jgi:hypothetical protein